MARNSIFRSCNSLLRGRGRILRVTSSPSTSTLITSFRFVNRLYTSSLSAIPNPPFRNSLHFHHPYSSAASSEAPSNIVIVKTDEDLNNAYKKVKDESLPAIFYFTATWCGPCRMIAPVIKNWSQEFPLVTTYKIDIDEAGLQGALGKLGITAVPTLHFFHNGKKESEVVGADLGSMNATVQRLFK